jgi:hypothetical protein
MGLWLVIRNEVYINGRAKRFGVVPQRITMPGIAVSLPSLS